MAKHLGGAIIGLLGSERVELRAAAATVLAAVGKGEPAVAAALAARLDDSDAGIRRIALEGLVDIDAGELPPRLVPLLRGDDHALAERALELLTEHVAEAEATLRKEVAAAGPIAPRRAMAQLLVRRGTRPALDAVLDQLADDELGEQALQLLRAEIDQAPAGKLADQLEKSAIARVAEAGKALARASAPRKAKPSAGKAKPAAGKGKRAGKAAPADGAGGPAATDASPDTTREVAHLGALLRLIGYLARPAAQPLLLDHAGAGHPRPIRLAAIAGLRRLVAQGDGRGSDKIIDKIIDAMIDFAGSDDPAVAQAAVDTLRGARIPEALAKRFAALAKSDNPAAQKLAMERLPAGGGASAVKPLVDALGGGDPTARDAAGRGLAKAPEAVVPVTRALLAATDEQIARRYAGVLRSHRGHVAATAIDELVDRVRDDMERQVRGKATADELVSARVVAELVADLAPARHVELLFDRARRLRKAGKSVEAFGSLKPLLRSRADIDGAIDEEQRFLLAVLALEAVGDSLIRTARTDDPVFEQFARLAGKGFPVARRLAREQDVSDEAIYALGFRLLESTASGHEDLGAELLQGIIEERPRSKLAKAARNKLKLTGHVDDD
ncbi:MAG TPA: hypothetical protein VHW23_09955 [Kofleriaceae bacterium]|nr:hypothetical protein [Kofleriaceae bacterium]